MCGMMEYQYGEYTYYRDYEELMRKFTDLQRQFEASKVAIKKFLGTDTEAPTHIHE